MVKSQKNFSVVKMIKKDYPYTFARVSAKKAKLLERKDYEDMIKMQPNGIARKLEEGDYKQDINDLGSKYDGVELIELALARNLSRTMAHLSEIASDDLKPVLRSFLRRYDILSIKRILRWKRGGKGGKGDLESMLVPVGGYSKEQLLELSEKEFDEICDAIKFPESEIDYCSYIKDADNLKEIERNLDRAYYQEMEQVSNNIGSKWFKDFIEREAEFENAKTALRLKKYGKGMDEMEKWSVKEEMSDTIKKIMNAKDYGSAVNIIEEDMLGAKASSDDIEDVEHGLEVERLDRALKSLHLEPPGATSILGYVVAKITEVKNLRMLIRAKETGIQNQETIRSNLIIA